MLKKCIVSTVSMVTLVFVAGVVAGVCANKKTLKKIKNYIEAHGCNA